MLVGLGYIVCTSARRPMFLIGKEGGKEVSFKTQPCKLGVSLPPPPVRVHAIVPTMSYNNLVLASVSERSMQLVRKY